MSRISVSPEELRAEAGHVKTKAEEARSDFAALKSKLDGLQSVFTGQAQDRFQARFQEWHGHANGLVEALDSLGQFLETAANTIEQTDSQLAQGLG